MAEDPVNESTAESVTRSPQRKTTSILILVLFVALIGAISYFYIHWKKVNLSLTKKIRNVTLRQEATIETLQQTLSNLQQGFQASEVKIAKLTEITRDIQGVQMDTWRAAEAAYLVRLANDQVQFAYDAGTALRLLQHAADVLQPATAADLVNLYQAIEEDIDRFKKVTQNDLLPLYTRLSTLTSQIDQLPLPKPVIKPLTSEEKTPVNNPALSWWQAGLYQSLALFKKIVIIHRDGSEKLPLILPDEKVFLYQNLHAQLDSLMWSVLHREPSIYEISLSRLITWTQKYFDQSSPVTIAFLAQLQALKDQDIRPTTDNLNATIQQFEQYFAQQTVKTT